MVHPDIRKAITQMGGIELMVIFLILTLKHIVIVSFPTILPNIILILIIFIILSYMLIVIKNPSVMIVINMFIIIMIIMIMISMSMMKVRILADSNKHLKLHAAESLSKLAKYKKVFLSSLTEY